MVYQNMTAVNLYYFVVSSKIMVYHNMVAMNVYCFTVCFPDNGPSEHGRSEFIVLYTVCFSYYGLSEHGRSEFILLCKPRWVGNQ